MQTREFKIKNGDKEYKLMVRRPIPEDTEESNRIRASVVAGCVRSQKQILLRSEIEDYLTKNNIWTSEHQSQLVSIQNDIANMLDKLRKGAIKLSEGRKIAIEITQKRAELMQLMLKRQVFDDATVESLAERSEKEYLLFASTINLETGERHWESFDDMKQDRNSEVYSAALNNFDELVYGVEAYERNLPEIKWLKKYDFVDEKLNFIDRKTKEFVTQDGKPVQEMEKEVAKFRRNVQGEIEEEQPFIDDYANEPCSSNEPGSSNEPSLSKELVP